MLKSILKIITLVMLCTLFVGCDLINPEKIKVIHAGKIVSFEELETSWNDELRTLIKTEKGTFTIHGLFSGFHDTNSWVNVYSNGLKYFCVEHESYCHLMY